MKSVNKFLSERRMPRKDGKSGERSRVVEAAGKRSLEDEEEDESVNLR